MYAIVKTGGKQYRVEQGQSLLVERLPASDGDSVSLQPLLLVDGSSVVDDADGLAGVTVAARVLAHERGPKLRIVKFKPKRGYKRRTGHRQELTRIEVTEISGGSGSGSGAKRSRSRKAASKEEPAAAEAAPEAAATPAATAEAEPAPAPEVAETPEETPVTPATTTNPEDSDGS